MIYLDTSVALAQVLAEGRSPPADFWEESLVSSKLLEYEVWNRLHTYRLAASHGDLARALIGRLALVRLEPTILGRALDPFPRPVRTLDALHLATFDYLIGRDLGLRLASYDDRMLTTARVLGWQICDCG